MTPRIIEYAGPITPTRDDMLEFADWLAPHQGDCATANGYRDPVPGCLNEGPNTSTTPDDPLCAARGVIFACAGATVIYGVILLIWWCR